MCADENQSYCQTEAYVPSLLVRSRCSFSFGTPITLRSLSGISNPCKADRIGDGACGDRCKPDGSAVANIGMSKLLITRPHILSLGQHAPERFPNACKAYDAPRRSSHEVRKMGINRTECEKSPFWGVW
jgi:hypothetical protein